MKRLLLLLLLAAPLTAQTTATIFLTSQHNTGSGTLPFEGQDLSIDFDDGSGFGASLSRDFGRWSGELDVRYLPLSISGRPSGDEERIETDVDPLLVSAGLRIRF